MIGKNFKNGFCIENQYVRFSITILRRDVISKRIVQKGKMPITCRG